MAGLSIAGVAPDPTERGFTLSRKAHVDMRRLSVRLEPEIAEALDKHVEESGRESRNLAPTGANWRQILASARESEILY